MKNHYEMKQEKPGSMDTQQMLQLKSIFLAPYMQLSTALIGKARHAGGNMFRHQIDTLAILIDYGYIDSVLLKASCVHDTIEDIPDFDSNLINIFEPEAIGIGGSFAYFEEYYDTTGMIINDYISQVLKITVVSIDGKIVNKVLGIYLYSIFSYSSCVR